jgi:transcriptional regulator with XRE-family HTH domain
MAKRSQQQRMRDYMERKASPEWTPSPLYLARRRAGLTREELGKRAKVGERTIDRLEQRDVSDVKLGTLNRLAWVLGCERLAEIVDPEWLEWGDGDKPAGPAPKLD